MLTALFSLSLLAQTGLPQDSLLRRVPPQAVSLWSCEDTASVWEQVQRNDLFRLLQASDGALITELLGDVWPGGDWVLRRALRMGENLRGQTIAFGLSRSEYGVLIEPPANRDAGRVALQSLLLSGPLIETRERGEASVSWLGHNEERPDIALIEHPEFLAVIRTKNNEAIVDAILAAPGDTPAPVVAGLLERRASYGPALQSEFFVDFSYLAADAKHRLRYFSPLTSDPMQLLGLAKTDLYATLQLSPGTQAELRGHLCIPPESLLADLADTFQPLSPDLKNVLPRATTEVHAIQWNLASFHRQLRKAQRELLGEDRPSTDQQLVQYFGDYDLEKDILDRLDGLFAITTTPAPDAPGQPEQSSAAVDDLERYGFLMGIRGGEGWSQLVDRMLAALLPGLQLIESEVEDLTLSRFPAEQGTFGIPLSGGFLFAPRHVAFAFSEHPFEAHLAALSSSNLSLEGTRLGTLLESRASACLISVLRLDFLARQRGIENPEDLGLFELSLVDHARRVPSGFLLGAKIE